VFVCVRARALVHTRCVYMCTRGKVNARRQCYTLQSAYSEHAGSRGCTESTPDGCSSLTLCGCPTRDRIYDALGHNSGLMRRTFIPICRRKLLVVGLGRLQLVAAALCRNCQLLATSRSPTPNILKPNQKQHIYPLSPYVMCACVFTNELRLGAGVGQVISGWETLDLMEKMPVGPKDRPGLALNPKP